MILVGLVIAVLVGLAVGRLAGFMGVEFIMRPLILLGRGIATVLGAVSGWARRLP